MTTYRVKEGFDEALLDLVDIAPQPASTGVQATRRIFGADGSILDEALYIELEYSSLTSESEYQALLAQFGLDTLTAGPVTLYAPNQRFTWTRYNGIAVLPEVGRDMRRRDYFVREVTILVKDLEVAS